MDRLADFRAVFAMAVIARAGCRDPRVAAAFARVPRHEFVGPGPWFFSENGPPTSSADPALLYQDLGVGLARDIPTGLPSLHARCMAECAVKPGERVIHVGAGMGYFTAILAELVGPAGEVLAFEIDDELASAAKEKLAEWPWARVEARSGVRDHGAANLIYVCAGVQEIPSAWIDALRMGDRLLVPLTPDEHSAGGVLLVERMASGIGARFVFTPARFYPCIGATNPELSTALRSAFERGDAGSVRSLRLTPALPDASNWFATSSWWLSRAELAD